MNPFKARLYAVMILVTAFLVYSQSNALAAFGVAAAMAYSLANTRPVFAANSLGSLASGLILVEALSQAVKLRPALSMVTTDFSAVPAKKDEVVRSRVIGAPTVNNFGSAASDRTDTNISVTLDGFKEVYHTFTAAELNSTSRNLVAESAAPIAEAISDHWMDLLGVLWASTTFTNDSTIASADYSYENLTVIRQAMNTDARAVPKASRFGVVNSDVYKELLNDPLCNRQYKTDPADPIADGELRGIAGFSRIFEFPGLPSTNNTNAFFGHKESTLLMVRPAANLKEMFPGIPADGNMGIISIPDPNDPSAPGLSVLAIEKIDALNLSVSIKLAWLQGSAVGRVSHGQRSKAA